MQTLLEMSSALDSQRCFFWGEVCKAFTIAIVETFHLVSFSCFLCRIAIEVAKLALKDPPKLIECLPVFQLIRPALVQGIACVCIKLIIYDFLPHCMQ